MTPAIHLHALRRVALVAAFTAPPADGQQAATSPASSAPPAVAAEAGADRFVDVGAVVRLNGLAARDATQSPLEYSWSLLLAPEGSAVQLAGADTPQPSFTPDRHGLYLLQLVVRSGGRAAPPDFVRIRANAGPSIPTIRGYQLQLARRRLDGTLEAPVPWEMRAVCWSPASRGTITSTGDPNNAAVRRPEFSVWADVDVPLLAAMNVNTVRTFLDFGVPSDPGGLAVKGWDVLDQLYRRNIFVVMTVDDAIHDTARVAAAVRYYQRHPAILAWSLGNEWNINRHYGASATVLEAAQKVQAAALLIHALDPLHPVVSSYGEIDIDADGLRLGDTAHYVNAVCPAADMWSLNVYRGDNFGALFGQWADLSSKPMFLGEFGTDAYDWRAAAPNPAMQAAWDEGLWQHVLRNLSARDPAQVCVGGAAFAFSDEWWKVQPAGSQETGGFFSAFGHPDTMANEEWFGLTDIDRNRRLAYFAFQDLYDPSYAPPPLSITYRAESGGSTAGNFAAFWRGATRLHFITGGAGGGRGFNTCAVDGQSGEVLEIRTFDTWATRTSGTAMNDLLSYIQSLPSGTLLLIAVCDEAGLNQFPPFECQFLPYSWVTNCLNTMTGLGSALLPSYCYWNSWAFVTRTGAGALDEELLGGNQASASGTITVP